MIIELKQLKNDIPEDKSLSSSKLILSVLNVIKDQHNQSYPQKVRINQLLEVFTSAEYNKNPDKSLLLNCFARVFLFLDILNGALSFNNIHQKTIKRINKQFIDISASWFPEDKHYQEAEAIIKKHGIDFSINSIDELYLSDSPICLFELYL